MLRKYKLKLSHSRTSRLSGAALRRLTFIQLFKISFIHVVVHHQGSDQHHVYSEHEIKIPVSMVTVQKSEQGGGKGISRYPLD